MSKIVAISDTHLHFPEIPDGDILIHSGDFSFLGTEKDCIDFNAWLGTLPHKHKICVPGNHDWLAYREPKRFKDIMTNAVVLINEEVTIEGLRIYGSPYTPEFGDWAYMYKKKNAKALWDMIPEGIDVLVTHGPPKGILDEVLEFNSLTGEIEVRWCGCPELYNRVMDIKPKVHFFGHIHENQGCLVQNGINFINASIMNKRYNAINKPTVIDI